jgi:hypothetical protein
MARYQELSFYEEKVPSQPVTSNLMLTLDSESLVFMKITPPYLENNENW